VEVVRRLSSSARWLIVTTLVGGVLSGSAIWILSGETWELLFIGALIGLLSSAFVLVAWHDKLDVGGKRRGE